VKTIRSPRFISALVFIIVGLLIPVWVSSPYYLGIFVDIMVNSMLAIAFVMMFRTGLCNLGLTAFWGMGAYLTAVMMTKWGVSFWLCLPAAAIVCALVGWGLGYIMIGRGRGGFNFVILSSVIGMIFPVIMGSIKYVGGYAGMSNIPAPGSIPLPGGASISFDSTRAFYYLAAVIFIVIVLVCGAFYRSWTGRAWKSIAINPRLAESLGIDVFHYRMVSIVVGSAFAGVVGAFLASYTTFVSPTQYGMWKNVYIQAYAVLGGMGFPVLGPLLGAAVMTVVPQAVQFSNLIAPLFVGVVLIILILFFPDGLLGIVTRSDWFSKALSRVWRRTGIRDGTPEEELPVPAFAEPEAGVRGEIDA
jgi:branched-chain amino acid transport system permease protein